MKTKKTTSMVVTGVLLVSGLGATLYAQDQHSNKTPNDAPPKMGMMHDKREEHHDNMMADMKAADAKMDKLVAKMNTAKGDAKVAAIAAVINEMVTQRKAMHAQMQKMHQQMMGDGMMPKPQAKPESQEDVHNQHH